MSIHLPEHMEQPLPAEDIPSNAEAAVGSPDSHVEHDHGLAELFHHSTAHARTATPRSEFPHEPTHRRYEHPRITNINQAAIGYTQVAVPNGLHYVKILGTFITLAAPGSIQFVQGSGTATDASRTGAINIAANGGFVLPVSSTETPWLFFSPDQAVGFVTVGTGAFAQGWIVWTQSPADQ